MNNQKLSEFIEDVKYGDAEAFGRIYDILVDRIYRFFFFRVGSREDAEDLTEQVFIKVWKNLKNYKDTGVPFEAWVFKIARNKVIDFYRTRKNQVSLNEILGWKDDNLDVEAIIEEKLTKEIVLRALKKIPGTYREIMTLKFIEELENTEISEILGKPVVMVE